MGQTIPTISSSHVIVCNKSSHNLTVYGSTSSGTMCLSNNILISKSSVIVEKMYVIIIDDNGNEIFIYSLGVMSELTSGIYQMNMKSNNGHQVWVIEDMKHT